MKVCFISDPESPHFRLFIKGLLERGHQVSHLVYGELPERPIVSPDNGFVSFSLLKGNSHGHGKAEYVIKPSGGQTLNIARRLIPGRGRNFLERAYAFYVCYGIPPAPGRISPLLAEDVNSYLFQLERCAARAQRLLRMIKPDILIGSFMTNAGYIAARTGFRPFISEAHGDDVLIRPDQSFIARMIIKYTVKKSDRIRSHARCITQRLLEYGGSRLDQKIATFPWGVDQRIFTPDRLLRTEMRRRLGWQDNPILVMTRFFEPVYGIEYFIDALPAVVRSFPEVRIILIGSGSLEGALRRRVTAYGLDRYVLFAGRVHQLEEMAAYLNAADVYVSVSLSEGSSTSLQEAMACALPVVVSDAGGNLEWVRDGFNGYVVPCRDSTILTQRLITLLKVGSLRAVMGARNRDLARQKANWQHNLTIFENICRELVSRNIESDICVE